jgi:tetratricopeptide (TPR) repeat protein
VDFDVSPKLQRAIALIDLQRWQQAESQVKEYLGLNPDDGEALALLAYCHMARKRVADAIDVSRQSIARAPDSALAHFILGHALRDEALQHERFSTDVEEQKACWSGLENSRQAAETALRLAPANPVSG